MSAYCEQSKMSSIIPGLTGYTRIDSAVCEASAKFNFMTSNHAESIQKLIDPIFHA